MPTKKDGVRIILSSPFGAGKTWLVDLLSKLDNFEVSISHTTREPRLNETPNKDYYFINKGEFNRLIKNQEFLEYAKVFNNLYGTTRTQVINSLNKVKKLLNEKDVSMANANQVKEITGFTIGGVSPVGHLNKVDIFIDESLVRFTNLFAAAGHPYSIFKINFDNLCKITNGSVKDISEWTIQNL